MAQITKQNVEHVARLARLELTETEKSEFTQELGEVLNYALELNQTSTSKVDVVDQISGLKNVTRVDKITNKSDRDQLLAIAPAQENGYIKVKKVFE